MAEDPDKEKESFLYPTSKYYGKFTPGNLAFNANLQEFAQRVSFLCGLESSGKVSPEETYQEIKAMWNQLKKSKKAFLDDLDSNQNPPE
jgi:hypothetical protein